LNGGAQLVAAGQAEIGIYPTSEVAHVKGLIIVGMLPAGIDFNTIYGGAAVANSGAPDKAAAFVKFMAAPENRGAWKDAGFDPPGK
jgi:molybdate transport system substrate-binding protein